MRHWPKAALAAVGIALGAPAPVLGAVTIGQTAPIPPSGPATAGLPVVQTQTDSAGPSYAMPFAGIVTFWSSNNPNQPAGVAQLKVLQPRGGDIYFVVGQSAVENFPTGPTISFKTHVGVSAGDRLGLFTPSQTTGPIAGYSFLMGSPNNMVLVLNANLQPGETSSGSGTSFQGLVNVSALLEADSDRDGFADESEDRCPNAAGPDAGCPMNTFTIRRARLNKAKGTATLAVKVPGAGKLSARDNRTAVRAALAVARPRVKHVSAKPRGAGVVRLRLKPTGSGKRRLTREGKLPVKVRVTFRPTGGLPNSQTTKLRLRLHQRI